MIKRITRFYKQQEFQPTKIGIFVNPFYFARKGLYDNIKALSPSISGKVLDVGCGKKPYMSLFNCETYIGLDVERSGYNHENTSIDVFYDGNTFPFPDNSFDSIICNEVFEHVFNPDNFLAEINRVLVTNGNMLITVPFMWSEHEQPYDYGRYSTYGITSLLNKHGFELIEGHKSTNDIRALFQIFNAYLYNRVLTKNKYVNLFIIIGLMGTVNLFAGLLNLLLPKSAELYLDYIMLVKKINHSKC